jgi:hypothetical protein
MAIGNGIDTRQVSLFLLIRSRVRVEVLTPFLLCLSPRAADVPPSNRKDSMLQHSPRAGVQALSKKLIQTDHLLSITFIISSRDKSSFFLLPRYHAKSDVPVLRTKPHRLPKDARATCKSSFSYQTILPSLTYANLHFPSILALQTVTFCAHHRAHRYVIAAYPAGTGGHCQRVYEIRISHYTALCCSAQDSIQSLERAKYTMG